MSHPFLITGHPDLTGPLEVALFESRGKTLASVSWDNGIKVIVKTAAQAREIAEAFNEAAINLDFNERRVSAAAAELAPTAPERTATPAEHADTAARIERARNFDSCGVQDEAGYMCTEPAAHEPGTDHIARTGPHDDSPAVARWPQDPAGTYVENITAVIADAHLKADGAA
jgi:hypothetical protein